MPIAYSEMTTPGGREVGRAFITGKPDGEESRDFARRFNTGGPWADRAMLLVMGEGAGASAEGRKAIAESKLDFRCPSAVVVPNIALRVLMTFLVRLFSRPGRRTEIFSREDVALLWIDEVSDRSVHGEGA